MFKKKNLKKHIYATALIVGLLLAVLPVYAQEGHVLDIGVRLQKTVQLYNENGISIQYSNDALLSEKLYFGLSYVTSRLGSALGSNAIKQHNLLLSSSLFFRPEHKIRPLVRLNTGYFAANYEEEMFKTIPHRSMLLSMETGLCFDTSLPLKITGTLGYNLITGNGVDGPGTLLPLYFQTTISWDILKK